MTTKQLAKLEKSIATLRSQNRIVWLEGVSKTVPVKGKHKGATCYFMYASSLNVDGGSWYYILTFEVSRWQCTCESYGQCKHQVSLNALLVARYRANKAQQEAREEKQQVLREASALLSAERVKGQLNGSHEFNILKV